MNYNNLKFKVTPDIQHKNHILNGLKRNKTKFGKAFCPCVLTKDESTICHCKKFTEKGDCCCKLFVIDVDLNNNNYNGVVSYESETDNYSGYVINAQTYTIFNGNTLEEAKNNFVEITNNL